LGHSDEERMGQTCAHCETETQLYTLQLVQDSAGRTELAICRFCYIRLTGLKPRQAQLIGRVASSRKVAPARLASLA
jgi:hypothetical protein